MSDPDDTTFPFGPLEIVLGRLDHVRMRWGGQRGMARCPAHDDSDPSLSIRVTQEGHVLLHCFAGCDIADICGAVGLTMAELYADERGYYRPGPQIPYRNADLDLVLAKLDAGEYRDPHLRPKRL